MEAGGRVNKMNAVGGEEWPIERSGHPENKALPQLTCSIVLPQLSVETRQ